MDTDHAPIVGASWAILATVCFTCVDVIIKFLSGDYPLYQITFLRTLVAITMVILVFTPLSGGYHQLKTKNLKVQLFRGGFVVLANLLFFTGLAALPLAEAVAIFFVSPMLIAVFSVFFLRETVGPRRWAAIAVGLLGVLIVMRPGSEAFQIAALFPIGAAACYAMLHILTRRIGTSDSAVSLVLYTQVVMMVVSVFAGFGFGHGEFNTFDHPSAAFLLRAWVWPTLFDGLLLLILGITISIGGLAISVAYQRSDAAFIAPFEYIAMPLAVIGGIVVFAEFPDRIALAGITLILASGLVLIWREAVARRKDRLDGPQRL
ncbi:DMT family transporter [Rhodobacteraceae bacterium]|nr:DMT family transporter [Paracoccaceae bacterium]